MTTPIRPPQPGREGYTVTKLEDPRVNLYVIHRTCPFCSKPSEVTVPPQGLAEWERGVYIQTAFPGLSADDRELVLTGTHPACWDEMLGDDNDAEDTDTDSLDWNDSPAEGQDF